MILVTTAGKVGAEATRLLAEQGAPVRVLVRDPDKAKPLADAGAEIAVADLAVPATLDAAMAGVTAVILVSPAVPAQELNVVASATAAGVGHVVKATSKASADSPIARRRGQAEIEAGLAASGLPHTLLRSNAYMQNVLMLAPAIAATSGFGSAAGNGRAGMVDTRDVAAVAAEIATNPARRAPSGSSPPTTPARSPEPRDSHASGIGRPKRASVIASGSGPPRWFVSRASIAASSSVVSSKSNTSMFSAMRCGLVDFGMTERPSCRCQRSMTWAGLLAWARAMPRMTGSSSVLVCPLSR
jgi:hypothetical protein